MNPAVSIVCIAYNHEKYIEKTLQSFLMQETTFDFEILIHDDASTDGTADIIRKYEKQYPDLIRPVYQTENQYSQNVEIVYKFNYKRARGKYLAQSEGDDYWTDPLKLQKQYDFLQSHPEVSACIHPDRMINEEGSIILGYRKIYPSSRLMYVKEALYEQKTVATNSIFMRNYFTSDYEVPQWYFDADVTDFPLVLYLATKGPIYYMNEVMSAYRVAAHNSWTQRTMTDSEKRRRHVDKMIELLESFDAYTQYEHTTFVQRQIRRNRLGYLMADEYLRINNPDEFFRRYRTKSIPERVKYNIYSVLPRTVMFQRQFKSSRTAMHFRKREVFPVKEHAGDTVTD